jgi:predicted amidohydrolase YtcJ
MLVHNIRGYSFLKNKFETFSAMLVEAGKVAAVGESADLLRRYAKAERLDGKGKALLPGLIDVHGHIFNLGYYFGQVGLADMTSLPQAQAAVASYAKANPQEKWILGRGWNESHWGLDRLPTASDLDAVVGDRPVALRRIDGHSLWANSLALKLAGIGADTADPPGGHITRDSQGNASGILIDKAMALVLAHVPAPDDAAQRRALDAALAHLRSIGLTGAGDCGVRVTPTEVRLYQEYAAAGKLTTRVYAMIGDVTEDFVQFAKTGPLADTFDGRFSLRTVKLFADGALGGHGAAMLEDYSDHTGGSGFSRGLLMTDDATMRSKIRTAIEHGYQVCVHAIGDAANRQVLDAFESVYKEVGGRHLRHRIEHAQIVSLPDLPRFKSLDLIASVQPTHATSDMNIAEAYIGSQRLKGAYAWRTLLDQGTVLAGGSDFPVEPANPFYGLHAAITRTDRKGQPVNGWQVHEALTPRQALRAFTLDAAYAQHQEDMLGSLEPGKWADFILVEQDPFAIDPNDIWKTEVLQTWVAGECVFDRRRT